MKENKYDDNNFFEKYSNFPRSVEGLSAAGEWHELKKMLPDFMDKHVLDIGCGFGWHCNYAAENGAAYVLGTDISEKMLKSARERTSSEKVEYKCIAMEDLEMPDSSFDIIISSLAFHYTPDFNHISSTVYKLLKPNGSFIFSVEHPVFTAQGSQDWFYDDNGKIIHWPVDNYFTEGERKAVFLETEVTKYHKTITTYINTLLYNGFSLRKVVEPMPALELLDSVPGMRDELRRPMMLLVSATKP